MVVKKDSLIARLVMRMPVWMFSIESARVGNDISTFVRIGV